jgi:hypothetical protein
MNNLPEAPQSAQSLFCSEDSKTICKGVLENSTGKEE